MTQKKTSRSGWKQWTPQEAKRALEAWQKSGKPLASYAREAGIGAKRLRWWRARLGEWRDGHENVARWVPVVARVEPPSSSLGVRVQLPGGAAAELEVSAESAAWVAAVALHLSRAP